MSFETRQSRKPIWARNPNHVLGGVRSALSPKSQEAWNKTRQLGSFAAVVSGQLAEARSKRAPDQLARAREHVDMSTIGRNLGHDHHVSLGHKSMSGKHAARIHSAGGRIGGRIVMHIRWHVNRGIKKAGCNLCLLPNPGL